MRVLRLLFGDLSDRLGLMLAAATFTALARLVVIEVAGQSVAGAVGVDLYQLCVVVVAVLVFTYSSQRTLVHSCAGLNRGIDELTDRLCGLIANSDITKLENRSIADLGAQLFSNTGAIRRLHFTIALALFRGVFILWVVGYLFFKSGFLGAIVVGMLGVAVVLAGTWKPGVSASLTESSNDEWGGLRTMVQLIRGFPSIKLHRERREEMMLDLKSAFSRSAKTRHKASHFFQEQRFAVETCLYLPVGLVVYVAIDLLAVEKAVALEFALALIFLFRSVILTLEEWPKLLVAAQSVTKLQNLEQLLRRCQPDRIREEGVSETEFGLDFGSIEWRNVEYRSVDGSGHQVSQLTIEKLRIGKGETLFIAGGNDTEKSTLLMLMAGLARPSEGDVFLNGQRVGERDWMEYRERVGAIWERPWLFDREYGADVSGKGEVGELLKWFGLNKATTFERGGFTCRDLSTGQRKRLALISVLMMRRPVVILDEWTAGQDPIFVKRFYEEILPKLKAQGTTVIMAHNDLEYEAHADRVLRLQDGRLVEE